MVEEYIEIRYSDDCSSSIDRSILTTVDRSQAGTGGQRLLKTLFVRLLIGGGSVVLSMTLALRTFVMIVSTNVLVMISEDYLSLVPSLVQYAWAYRHFFRGGYLFSFTVG